MVMHQIRGEDFDVSIDRVLVSGLKIPQPVQPASTEFQVGFLDQVVDGFRRAFAPLTTHAERDAGNERLKAAYKFRPGQLITRLKAGVGEILRRQCGVVHEGLGSPLSTGDSITFRVRSLHRYESQEKRAASVGILLTPAGTRDDFLFEGNRRRFAFSVNEGGCTDRSS